MAMGDKVTFEATIGAVVIKAASSEGLYCSVRLDADFEELPPFYADGKRYRVTLEPLEAVEPKPE